MIGIKIIILMMLLNFWIYAAYEYGLEKGHDSPYERHNTIATPDYMDGYNDGRKSCKINSSEER